MRLRRARHNEKQESLDFWKNVKSLGLEILDLRCDHCDKEVRLHPKVLLSEFKPHRGKTRSSVMRGYFNMTLSIGLPMAKEDEFGDDESFA